MIYRAPEPPVEIPSLDLASFVLAGAHERGHTPALVDVATGAVVTYRQLAHDARSVAAGLAARGFGPGDVLGVLMPNVGEYPLLLHGAALAGGACTTLNPLYTPRELVHQLGDAGARFLVTVPQCLEAALAARAELPRLEELFVIGDAEGAAGAMPFGELLGDPADAPAVAIDPERDVAVLPYSSGTTGRSKGVMLTHANIVADICQAQAALPIEARDRLVGVLPFFHIYGMTIVLNQGLRAGATVVPMARFDFGRFLDLIERHAVTKAYVAPPIALALAKDPAVDGRDLSSLTTVVSGGAPLGAELAQQLEQRIGCEVLQAYGLTETSSMTHTVRSGARGKHESIGQPLPNTESRLVDPGSGRDAGPGERGELWIRGPQVMRGYLGNPEASAETLDEDGWLHSGDVAEVDDDGCFRIVDRLKELIKFKGFQVAPAELEALIDAHPGVAAVPWWACRTRTRASCRRRSSWRRTRRSIRRS